MTGGKGPWFLFAIAIAGLIAFGGVRRRQTPDTSGPSCGTSSRTSSW